jgi:hypothetical protein
MLEKLEEALRKINKIEDLTHSQQWEINNQDLPNFEQIEDTLTSVISDLESISGVNSAEKVDDEALSDIQNEVYDLKNELTEIINEMSKKSSNQFPELTEDQFNDRHAMLVRSSSYVNHVVFTGIINVANKLLYSANIDANTFHQFYLILCTLEHQLSNVFKDLEQLAGENEIHDLSDYQLTVKLESKRDLAKHKRNYEMEENNG